MTTARIETVYTLDDAIKELDKRLTRKIRRIKKKIQRLLLDFSKIIIATFLFYGFMCLICLMIKPFL